MIFRITAKKKTLKSEDEILDEFRISGDIELLGELYSGYMHLVYGVCLKYLKSREESMDAVMQIFEKLITEIPRHRIENFRNWLHVVAKNYCLMQLRAEKTREEKMEDWQNEAVTFMENDTFMHPVDDNDPDMEMMLNDCIEKLKNDQKECIRQFYFADRCYKEIALDLGLDEKKVKSCLQNAKRNLKFCLEEKNAERQ